MERNYVKRTQKDYTLQFKLQAVREVEVYTVSQAQRNYGIQCRKQLLIGLTSMVILILLIK